ncbi:MAG: 3-phosphoshikimate 1-carboxyvinyltransferase [Candidatus Omnitrophica bacterium]|nr:3-phosphoshikimate 1-carboxyvinyltransferase [Candidatus Omnitrophota bacterium]
MPSLVLQGSSSFKGIYCPPGDKSISHRAVMFGALAEGESRFTHFLEAEDCLHTLQAFESMGIKINLNPGKGELQIQGAGLQGLHAPKREIYLGNSGTSIRLLLGILAGQRFEVTLTGDSSLSSRPMKRVTEPLKKMGAQIKGRDNGNFAPLTIRGGNLKSITFDNKLSSAQVKSALLFAGLFAEGETRILESLPSRDHQERFLRASGANFRREKNVLVVEKTAALTPLCTEIPGDFSSAAFFIAAASFTKGSDLLIDKVSLNPTRTGMLQVLRRMGASLEVEKTQELPEPIGKIRVRGASLKGARISRDEIPSLIDELPILMTLMALAEGESLISGAEELRVKETDRILSMVTNLNELGGKLKELPDGCMIEGVKGFRGGKVTSFGDHRTAMSLAIASLHAESSVEIEDIDCVKTSFPSFFEDFDRLKARPEK